jgi:O-antigen/teichoic acid export membrane protein
MNKDSDHRQTAKHVTRFLFSTVLVQAVGLLRSIVIPVLFNPAQLGTWNLMNVIIGYGGHAHLGLLHGMNKIIPLFKGQGKSEKIEETKNSVFWVNLIIGISAGGLLLLVSFNVSDQYALYLQIVAVIIFLQQIFYYQFSLLRGESRFNILIRGTNIFSLLSAILVVGILFAFTNRLLGALIGLAGAYLCATAYWFYGAGYRFSFRLSTGAILESFRLGIPLTVIGFLDAFFMSMDRWIIAKYLDINTLGYYSLAVMASGLLIALPSSASSILYPRMLERFAANPEPKAIMNLLIGPLRATSVVMFILIALAAIGLPLLIQLFLPKFLPSNPIIEILMPASFFLSITAIPGFYLTSVNKQRYQIVVIIIAVLFSLIVDYILFTSGFGVIGIALGTAAGYFVYGTGYTFLSVFLALGRKSKAISFMLQLIIPFLVMVFIIGVTGNFMPEGTKQIDFLTSSIWRMTIVMGVLLPTIWLFNRDGEVFSIINMMLKSLLNGRI